MIMVSIEAFDWHSVAPSTLRRMPKSETFVMLSTVALVVATHNLAIGVIGGVLVASVLFVRRVAHFARVDREVTGEGDAEVAGYRVSGELFFASSNDLTTQFEYRRDPERVVIDMSGAHVWDASTVAALDAVVTKYERLGKRVELVGMNARTSDFHARLTGTLGGEG
jgi:SulP family sulfate permease